MPMNTKAVRNLLYAQVSFFSCLMIAVLMTSRAFTHNYGLSFYGSNYPTVVPFALGLMLCNIFLLRATGYLPVHIPPFNKLRPLLRFIALLLLGIMLTPDSAGPIFYDIHIIVTPILFGTEMLIMLWLTAKWNGNPFTWSLLAIQFLAGAVALLSQLHVTHYLSQGTLIYQLVFGLSLIWTISQLISETQQPRTANKITTSRQSQS